MDSVLDARQRLTSSSGTRSSYDGELMNEYASARLNGALPMAVIVMILALMSSFWVPALFTALWAGVVLLSLTAAVLVAHQPARGLGGS